MLLWLLFVDDGRYDDDNNSDDDDGNDNDDDDVYLAVADDYDDVGNDNGVSYF